MLEDAPPLKIFRTYELMPVEIHQLDNEGYVMSCKRALGDPKASFIQFLDNKGDLGVRFDFSELPLRVENITFSQENVAITGILPWNDGTYFLCGFARETTLDARLHALVYRIDGNGTVIGSPLRRFITNGSVLERKNDLNALYRTEVRAARTSGGYLMLAVRYENANEAACRIIRLSPNGEDVSITYEHFLESRDHTMHGFGSRSNGEIWLATDGPFTGSFNSSLLIHLFTMTADQLQPGGLGSIDKKNASITGFIDDGSQVKIMGNFDRSNNEPWSFIAVGATPFELTAHEIAGDAEAAQTLGAARSNGSSVLGITNIHEIRFLSLNELRNDRVSTLRSMIFNDEGQVTEYRDLVKGQGARALGVFGSSNGDVVIGVLHPFLNTDYQHTFFLVISEE